MFNSSIKLSALLLISAAAISGSIKDLNIAELESKIKTELLLVDQVDDQLNQTKRAVQDLQVLLIAHPEKLINTDDKTPDELHKLGKELASLPQDQVLASRSEQIAAAQRKQSVMIRVLERIGSLTGQSAQGSQAIHEKQDAVTTKSSQDLATIAAQQQAINNSLSEVNQYIARASAPTKIEQFKQALLKKLPSQKTVKKAAFVGTGAAIIGGLYSMSQSPIETILDDEGREVHQVAGSQTLVQRIKKNVGNIVGIFNFTPISQNARRQDVARGLRDLERNNVRVLIDMSYTDAATNKAVFALYKPGIFSTPLLYCFKMSNAIGQHNIFTTRAMVLTAAFFGATATATEKIYQPLALKAQKIRSFFGFGPQSKEEQLNDALSERGIKPTAENKRQYEPHEAAAKLTSFFKQNAIELDESNLRAMQLVLHPLPVGLFNAILDESLEAARKNQGVVTSDVLTSIVCHTTCKAYGHGRVSDEAIAKISGQLLAHRLQKSMSRIVFATAKPVLKPVVREKDKDNDKDSSISFQIQHGEILSSDGSQDRSTSSVSTIKNITQRLSVLMAGKIAQEELGSLTQEAGHTTKELIGSDEDENEIHQLCTMLIAHKKGLQTNVSQALQDQLALEIGEFKKSFKKNLKNEMFKAREEYQAIFWTLKNNGHLTAAELRKLSAQIDYNKYEPLEREKGRYQRKQQMSKLMQELMKHHAQAS